MFYFAGIRSGVLWGYSKLRQKFRQKLVPGVNTGSNFLPWRKQGMMPLTMAKAGETATIRKISGKDEVRQHLAELGFVVDSDVTVVSEIGGNLIVQVKDSRIALDKTMANRIMI